jgi:hypothetical protein
MKLGPVPFLLAHRVSQELDDLSDSIDEQATKSQATSADGVSVQRRTLKELDDHYDRKAGREAASAGRLGINIIQLRMPGAADGRC